MKALNAALWSQLAGGTALTALLAAGTASIFHLKAPDDAALSYVVFSLQGGGDENLTGNRTKNLVVFVRGYAAGTPAAAAAIDVQIDARLHEAALSVSGYTTFWCRRENDLEGVEKDAAGVPTYMAGGFYRIRIDKD